jgi:hypothetical protein
MIEHIIILLKVLSKMNDSLYMLRWSSRSYPVRYTVILVTSRDCSHITWSRNPASVPLLATIHTIWNMNKDKITTLLSMNVIKSYDHVSREKLLHNLKKKWISTWIVAWTNNFMQDKRINFIVKTKQMIMNNVNVDISQKSSMSSILYLFYNVNLLKFFKQSSRKMIVIDFVNDINIFIYDINMINNCRLLKKMREHCLLWNRRHEIVFASIKYELIHLTKNIAKVDIQTSIKICDVVKQSFNHVRVLNVQIDNKLK